MFNKLRKRIMLLCLVVTSLVMLTSFSVIYLMTLQNLQTDSWKKLSAMGELDFETYAREEPSSADYYYSFMLLVDGSGKVIDAFSLCGYPDSDSVFDDAARFAWFSRHYSAYKYFNSYWNYQIREDKGGLYRIAFLEATNDRNTLGGLLFILGSVGVGTLGVIFLFSRFLAGRVIKPVEEAWERQKRFVADASHELKTPLMTIMTNCDVLEVNGDETVKSQQAWLESIKVGADRMGKLVNGLLTLARVDGMEVQEEKRFFDLNELISEVITSMDAVAAAKNLRVRFAVTREHEAFGYADSVRQVFSALYENAVKYANECGSVEVDVLEQRKQLFITVRNTGKGILPKDLPRIFDRFYRADTARSAEDGSYGLGLAIARGTAERIGGRLTAKSVPDEQTEFTFCFANLC